MKFSSCNLYHVDTNYINYLHNIDKEIMCSSTGYDKKPYFGMLVTITDRQYLIPVTSAKEKHRNLEDVGEKQIRIFEIIDMRSYRGFNGDIIVELSKEDENQLLIKGISDYDLQHYKKKIYSVLMIGKMFPVDDSLITKINLSYNQLLNREEILRLDLENKENSFCISIKNVIEKKAHKLYSKTIKKGRALPFCCNFIKLEDALDLYI